ncbi:MAG TPA: LURP-one-related family protein [Tepidisphaeraceae bacterium]|nr:LURP-one-related family protein [Tepidisphaeraceae bacterium]
MKYLLGQKLFALGDDYTIKDEAGNDAYFIDGKAFTVRDHLTFQDMSGNELCVIQKKLLAWGPTYEIYHNGALSAVVKESIFSLLGHRFTVDDQNGPSDLEAGGNFTSHEYTFTRAGTPVARASESWFTLADTYAVDIADGEDPVLILACAVVIDRCAVEAEKRR